MALPDPYIAVDWGTTNRRGYRIEHGRCAEQFEDDRGILSVDANGFAAAVAQIRARLGDHPLLMAGMIGSSRGWMTAPYASCPADIAALSEGLVWPEARSAIVPGVSYAGAGRADVMRGDNVQDAHGTQRRIHFHHSRLSGKCVTRIGRPLSLCVEFRRRRIERTDCR